jgi:putative ABC transport system ATP-binding protein
LLDDGTAGVGMSALNLQSVRKIYGSKDNQVVALAGVTLEFAVGSFTAIMGPSGSGKSTLLQCAAGLDSPTSGTVTLAGTNLAGLSENALTMLRRDRIGFVFQSFNLLSALTAEQNVMLPLKLAGINPEPGKIAAVLEAVGLAGRAKHRPSEMSGGQQQRIAIARALVTRPAVLFADEPTGALDTSTSREMLTLLRSLADNEAQTIIMVTHDPLAASYADWVVFLADGQVAGELADPTPDTVAGRMTELTAC